MTLEQIDTELAQWQTRLSLVSTNLIDLDDLFTFKRLRGDIDLSPAALSGITETKVTPCLAAVKLLWDYLRLLRDNLQTAQELRKTLSRFWMPDATLKQIVFHLTGPSITLPTAPSTLAERSLLSGTRRQNTATPEAILAIMTRMFELSKETILEVDSAWARLDKSISAVNSELNALQEIAAMLGETEVDDLNSIMQRIAYLQSRIDSDPLGVTNDIQTQISPQIERVRVYLNSRKLELASVQKEFARTRTLLSELKSMNEKAAKALDECRATLANPKGLLSPLSQSAVADLEDWYCTLESTMHEGKWRPARIGIERLLQTTENHLSLSKKTFETNQAPLELRAELKGRFGSLRAKAQFYGQNGRLIDAELERLAAETEKLLRQDRIPIEDALRIVQEYEKRVGKLSAPKF